MASKTLTKMPFNGPFSGLNTLAGPTMLGDGELQQAYNVWIKSGRIYPRPGYKRKDTAADATLTSYWTGYSVDFSNGTSSGYKKSYVILQMYFPNSLSDTYRIWTSNTSLATASLISASGATIGSDRATYMKAGDWTIICTGGDTIMTKIASDGTHTDRPAGFVYPAAAATLSATTSGAWGHMTGAFTYRYTFYDSTYGYESAPSSESLPVSGTTVGMIVSPGTALPSGASHYRIYRRRIGSALLTLADGTQAGDGVGALDSWYLANELATVATDSGTAQAGGATTITLRAAASGTNSIYNGHYVLTTGGTGPNQSREITAYNGTTKVATVSTAWSVNPDNTTTYVIVQDNLYDEELGREAPIRNYQPNASLSFATRDPLYCAYHRNRAFYAADDNVIWYSELPDPATDTTSFPSAIYVGDESFFTIPTGQSEFITALWSYGRVLLVFTNQRVFACDTDTLPDSAPVITELIGATGTNCYWSIQASPPAADRPGVLFWLHTSGIQMFNGSVTQTISRVPLSTHWPGILSTQLLALASSYVDEDRLQYVLHFPYVTVASGNTFCYSIAEGQMSSWLLFPSTSYAASCFFKTYDTLNSQWSRIYGCLGDRYIIAMDSQAYPTDSQYTDAGTNFSWSVTFKDFAPVASKATFGLFRVSFDDAPASALSLNCSVPGSSFTPVTRTPTFVTSGGYGLNYATANVGITADKLRLALSGTVAGSTDMQGITGYALDIAEVGR